jgi:hypothetical protein
MDGIKVMTATPIYRIIKNLVKYTLIGFHETKIEIYNFIICNSYELS